MRPDERPYSDLNGIPVFAEMSNRSYHRLDQRNPFFASDRFRLALRIAGDQRAVGAGRRLGVAKDVNPVVDLFFELVFVNEAVDLDGAEEVGSLQVPACAERRRTANPL